MSRNYANISTAIWRNEEFRDLSRDAQWMYLLLTSQQDISAAGVLPLSIRRWSTRAKGCTRAVVIAALEELARHRFVVYDNDTEELLVRSFVRWDGGYTNPKRRPVIQRAAEAVESDAIQRSLAREFQRLGLPEWLPDCLSDRQSDGPSQAAPEPASEPKPPPIDEHVSSQEDSLSDRQSDTVSPSDGVVVPLSGKSPTTHNPHSTTPAPAAPPGGDRRALTPTQRSKMITDAYASAESMLNWPAVNGIVLKAIRADRWTDDEIQAALMRLAADGRSVTTETLRRELTGPPRQRASPPRPSTTDERVSAGLALADRYDQLGTLPLGGTA